MLKLLIFSIIISISFSACQSKSSYEPIIEPSWITNPQKNGKIGAVGTALPHFKGKTFQRHLAVSRGLDELALQKGVNIQSQTTRKEGRYGASTSSQAEVYSVQDTTSKEINAHIEAVWTNPRTQEIYIWLLAD